MANYTTTPDLLADALFRVGEPTDGTSDFDTVALTYLNRVYQALCLGGEELNPDLHEDWWWLRKSPPGLLTLQPVITTGTVAVTNNNTAVTFSSAPSASVAGWLLKVDGGSGDVYRILSHTASDTAATLDGIYTGSTDGAASYTLMKLEYALASDVLRLISPMRCYRAESAYEIDGVDITTLDRDFPLALIDTGVPSRFAPVTETTIRFNRAGSASSTDYIRVEYDYLYMPDALTDDVSSVPVVPLHHRRVLADWTTLWLLMDKNDDRSGAVGMAAKAGLAAMATENRHKQGAIGRGRLGQLVPRLDQRVNRSRGPLRTSSGLIVG